MYYTYVLRSLIEGKLYIGWTNDVEKRLEKHNKGSVKATKSRHPLELIYFEGCISKEKAIEREKQLKTGFGRKYISGRI